MKLFHNRNVQALPKLKPGIKIWSDGMPCIVPEEPTIGKIPNAFNGLLSQLEYTIPNPALPKGRKPEKKDDM
ncbi:MAG: hypothetical protein ACXWV9_11805 [Flavisolibacter sp.]